MRTVGVDHKKVVATHDSDAFILHCTAVHGDAFANRIAITNDELRIFSRVFQVS